MKKLRGKGMDGASTMSGHATGVQERLRKLYPKAKYFTHCRSHCLNLVVVASCHEVRSIKYLMSNFQQITFFFSYSPKQKTILKKTFDQQIENQTGRAAAVDDLLADSINEQSEVMDIEKEFGIRRCLPTLSDTRWLARIDSLSTLLHSYRAVCEALETVAEESTGQAASDATGYYNHVTSFAFIVAAVVSQYLLGYIRPLSVALQSKSCDLLTAYEDANSLQEVLS